MIKDIIGVALMLAGLALIVVMLPIFDHAWYTQWAAAAGGIALIEIGRHVLLRDYIGGNKVASR